MTGGTGKSGRRVAARLAALGHDVRIGSRSGTPPFDWNEPATWPAVLDGARVAWVAYVPDLAFPGALDTIRAFSAEAVGRGVRRLVLLSGRGEEEALAAEQVVRDSGAEWTIVRAAVFAQDFSEHFLLGPVLDGVIALPAGDVAEPFVDVDDIAEVAVAALTDTTGRHAGQVYEVPVERALGRPPRDFADYARDAAAAGAWAG